MENILKELDEKFEKARANKLRFANGKTLGEEFEEVSKVHLGVI